MWYFAFGANMTAKKLTDSRGIKPFEATNGFIPGWRLAFNHKCVTFQRCTHTLSASPRSRVNSDANFFYLGALRCTSHDH